MSALAGKHAVVTGGGRGIGAAIVASLAEQGATLTLMGRDESRLHEQASALETKATVGMVSVDVEIADSVSVAFARASTERGPIEILINNAGAAQSARFGRTDLALWLSLIHI